jgi:hypothetical protein
LCPAPAGLGVTIESFTIENDTVRVTVPEDSEIEQQKARTLLAAARPLVPSAAVFETYKRGPLMATFTSEAIDRWSTAPEDVQPLLMVELLHESAVGCGADETENRRDAIATCVRFTINEPVSTPPTPGEIRTIDRRLETTSRIAARHGAGTDRELSEPLKQLRTARESLKRASRNRHYALQFGKSVTSLSAWADQHMGTLLSDEQ